MQLPVLDLPRDPAPAHPELRTLDHAMLPPAISTGVFEFLPPVGMFGPPPNPATTG